MTIKLHKADKHAPFMHRYVKTERHIIRHNRKGEVIQDETITNEFVICAHCGHWVNRVVPGCLCVASCHALADASLPNRYQK